jgi:hypothetical protein
MDSAEALDIKAPEKWKPDGARKSVWSISFTTTRARPDIRNFARVLLGPWHIVLWMGDDLFGEYTLAFVWTGLSLHRIQVSHGHGGGDIFGSRRKLMRLYRRYEARK